MTEHTDQRPADPQPVDRQSADRRPAQTEPTGTGQVTAAAPPASARGLPAIRIGLIGGAVGMLCCVGPTVLALIGVLSAATAYTWGENLYNGYAWWFRLGGLVATVALVVWALRRRKSCSIGGARTQWRKLALLAGVAVATYGVLYGLTTLAGTFAT